MKIALDIKPDEGAALLRFLRRVPAADVESTLRDTGHEIGAFDDASEKLRLALCAALDKTGTGQTDTLEPARPAPLEKQ
jgi:hypothetical protein